MIQFFAPELLSTLTLPDDEARHCMKVLRHRVGDLIEVIDGSGTRYTCRIVDDNPRRPLLEIAGTVSDTPSWPTYITLAVAPTKNIDRMEWMVEKLTEIGVNRIVPLLCRHSERRELKLDRLTRIAVSAMKQSLKTRLPRIDPLTPFSDFLDSVAQDNRFVAYCDDAFPRVPLARVYPPGASSATILIGPEGDFDPTEIAAATEAGYRPVTLGDQRLRTETAAITACDTIHIINQL